MNRRTQISQTDHTAFGTISLALWFFSLALALAAQPAFAVTNDGYQGNVIPASSVDTTVRAPGGTLVNPSSGNMFFSRTDLSIPGRGLPLEVRLSYNSVAALEGGGPYFSPRWHFNYDMSCRGLANGDVVVTWGDGLATTFQFSGGLYNAPLGIFATLEQANSNTLRLTTKYGIAFFFDLPVAGATTPLKSIHDPNESVVTLTYNPTGQLTTITDTSGRNVVLGYTGTFVTTITDSNTSPPRILHYGYTDGNLTSITDLLGNVTIFAYTGGHLITQITDPLGITSFVYLPGTGMVTNIARSSLSGSVKSTRSFSYDTANRTTAVIDVVSGTTVSTSFHYNDFGYLEQIADPLGHVKRFTYSRGDLTSSTDGNGKTTSFTYGSMGNLLTLTDPLNHTTVYTYNTAFNKLSSLTDPNGQTATFAYDTAGNLISSRDPLGNEATYLRDGHGQLMSLQNARGFATTFSYDSVGNVTGVTDSLGRSSSFTYDAVGNMLTKTDANNRTTHYLYDAGNRVRKAIFQDNSQALFGYNAQGDVLSIVDQDTDQAFLYDAAGRLLRVTDNRISKTMSYRYDSPGNRIQMTDSEGDVTNYGYDLAGRLTAITRNGQSFTYAYDKANRQTRLAFPNRAVAIYRYDTAGRLLSLVNQRSDNTVISSFTYHYDNAGNRSRLTLATGEQIVYGYDARNQLLSEVRTGGTVNSNHHFAYDPVGDRVQLNADGVITSYIFNKANELIKEQTGEHITLYSYDSNGNLGQKISSEGDVGYSYDLRNRLIGFLSPTTNASYAYDAFDRRIAKSSGGATTQFFYDGLDAVAEYHGSGALQAKNLFGRGIDQNLARFTGGGAFYYLHDGLNSVRNIVDASQVVQNSYDYDAWGNIVAAVEAVGNDYTFTGRQLDRESGLYYFRARMYSPSTGLFSRTDPLGNLRGRSLYLYTDNNPVNFIDPLGTCQIKTGGGEGEGEGEDPNGGPPAPEPLSLPEMPQDVHDGFIALIILIWILVLLH